MPRSTRPRRPSPAREEEFDDDFEDDSFALEQGQERLKQLMLDLVGRWHWIALGLVIGLLGATYYLSKAPKNYESVATLLVKQQTSSVMAKSEVEEMDLKSTDAMNTVSLRIKRPELFLRIAARPDIRALPNLIEKPVNWLPAWAEPWLKTLGNKSNLTKGDIPTNGELAKLITKMVETAIVRNSRLVTITATHRSPEVSTAIANAVAEEYIRDLTNARSEGRTNSYDILVNESEQAKGRLQIAQNALANYVRAMNTVKDLEMKENTVTDLKRRYKDKHPKMISAQSELAAYQAKFLSEFEDARNAVADKEYWKTNEKELGANTIDSPARLQTARRLLIARGAVLESEIASQNSVFNSVLTRRQETDINQQAVESEVEISSGAVIPDNPTSPKPTLILGGASMLGLGSGVLLALILMRLDNKLHTVAQAERETSLPILSAIADIQAKSFSAAKAKFASGVDAGNEARQRWDPRLVFRDGMSSTTYAEMFRVLRASVSLLGDERKRRVTLFSSALPGEGKTLVSSNFAMAAAQQGKRTLLVDMDLRKPSVHKVFGVKRDTHAYGTTEVLAGLSSFKGAIYTDTGEPFLHIMLSGKQAPNPGELLNVDRLREFLREALENYDLVVLDSAPLLAVPDTRVIAPLVDNFCLVVRAEYVPKGAVRRVISLLQHDHNLPSGIVFNGYSEKRRLIGQNYTYGNYQTNRYGGAYRYGYGSYGSYGSDEKE